MGADLEEEGVTGSEDDVADLVGEACAVAVDGDDGGVVEGAEVGFADGLGDEGEVGLMTASQSCRPRRWRGETS